jgi:predicted Mrr-cat superfamily restriction endonuclease
MTLWLARAGQHGEHETKFLDTGKIYLTWSGLRCDLSQLATKQALQQVLRETYPDASKGRIINHSGQIWTFTHEMRPGDWLWCHQSANPRSNRRNHWILRVRSHSRRPILPLAGV